MFIAATTIKIKNNLDVQEQGNSWINPDLLICCNTMWPWELKMLKESIRGEKKAVCKIFYYVIITSKKCQTPEQKKIKTNPQMHKKKILEGKNPTKYIQGLLLGDGI